MSMTRPRELAAGGRFAVGRNTVILLAVNFSSAGFGLLISVLIARGAGALALGGYSLALAWNLTLAQFADLGMNTLLTRDIARRPQDTRTYVRASLWAKAAIGLVLVLALVLTAPLLAPGGSTLALQVGSGLILTSAWYGTFTAVFRAGGRMLPILVLNAGGLLIQSVGTWWLVQRAAGVETLVLLALLIQLAQLGGAWAWYAIRFAPAAPSRPLELAQIAALARAGLPFALAGILAGVELRANVFLLGALAGERAVGWYSAASRLSDGLRLAPNAFFGALLPALAALEAHPNRAGLVRFFRRSQAVLIGFGAGSAILLTLLAPQLIPLLYGEGMTPAVPVLVVLGWGLIPALAAGLLVLYLYARGDERFVNLLLAVGLGVQVLAALVLMRLYGAAGAALGALLSDLVLWFLLARRIREREAASAAGGQTNAAAAPAARRSLRAWTIAAGPPLALFALALGLRILPVVQNHFDGLYGQDAYAYYSYAVSFLAALRQGQFPPPFWWPLGYPAQLALGLAVGGVGVGSAQAITLLTGALVAPVAYALAREVAPARPAAAGWIAGLICAVNGQLIQSSVVIMADAPGLFWATLSGWLLLRYRRTHGVWTIAASSLAAGMAVWTRWQNLLFLGAWLAALVLIQWRRERGTATARAALASWLALAGAVALVALVLSPQLWVRVSTQSPLAGQSWLEGWSPFNMFSRSFDTVDGHFDFALPVAVFYAQVLVHPAYLVALLTPLLGVGLVQLIARLKADAAPAVLLAGWAGGMLVFLMGIPYENFRFGLGFFAPLAVVTGLGAGGLWERARAPWARVALASWIALALGLMVFWQGRVLAPVLAVKQRELSHLAFLSEQLPAGALLYTFEIDGAIAQYSSIPVVNVWQMDPGTVDDNRPTFLYLDVADATGQWRGRLPDQLYRALSETNLLHPAGAHDGWNLYRVRACRYRILDCE